MRLSNLARQHLAALRALLVLTVILGIAYPVLIWLVAQLPGLRDQADGSLIEVNGKPVGSSLIGQSFTDADGTPLPRYFQSRPSAAGYNPMATTASNLGPESIVDSPDKAGTPNAPRVRSLLTLVCRRSVEAARLDGVDGARPFCTGDGVGAVLSVIGPRSGGTVVHPTRVVSVNQLCPATPFLATYEGVRVECAHAGENYSIGQIVPIRGTATATVPADAVTAGGSGLDPDISVAYAELQVDRVAKARGLSPDTVRGLVAGHTIGRTLGFLGEPRVNVLELNIALDALSAGG